MNRRTHGAALLAAALFTVTGTFAPPAGAQKSQRSGGRVAYTPQPGTRERKAILDALRKPVQKRVGRPVIFLVGSLKVINGWAMVQGNARKPDGKDLGDEFLWGELAALLRRKPNGTWVVLTWDFATDTSALENAARRYPKAPRALFPNNGNFGG